MSVKKIIIALALVVTGVGTFAITTLVDKVQEVKSEKNNTAIEENINTSESDKESILDIYDYISVNEKDGYITSIKQGVTDSETIELNNLSWGISEGFKLDEMLKMKNIAENFAQSMALYDCKKPNKYVDIAKKYVSNEVDNVFLRIPTFASKGAQENTKRMEVTNVECFTDEIDREGKKFEIEVDVSWNWIDNYDKIVSKGVTTFYISVKNIDGEFKVSEYFID